jgi:hypothetical protein
VSSWFELQISIISHPPQVHEIKQPFGGWSSNPEQQKAGLLMTINAETGMEAYTMALFTRVLGMSMEEVKELCEGAVEDIKNPDIHAYNLM